jgi:hypothetical protein
VISSQDGLVDWIGQLERGDTGNLERRGLVSACQFVDRGDIRSGLRKTNALSADDGQRG